MIIKLTNNYLFFYNLIVLEVKMGTAIVFYIIGGVLVLTIALVLIMIIFGLRY